MDDDKTSLKKVVAAFLRSNPGFLEEYPDIVEIQELSHRSGVATSLIERQVDLLREKNEEMSRQLSRLVQVAAENERLMSRLHRLTLELLSCDSREEFFTHLGNSLLNDFKADILKICLFDKSAATAAGEDVSHILEGDADLEQFRSNLDKDSTVCGRMNDPKLEFLFGTKARWVQSTALVPLGDAGCHGLMAIGSSDPARFYPGMGTLFLDLLADVISSNLESQEEQRQRRSA